MSTNPDSNGSRDRERGAPRSGKNRRDSYCLPNGKMDCAEIRDLLFDYMARELGRARSDLVRGHLLKCERCKAAAAEIRSAVALLKQGGDYEPEIPRVLTPDRRAKVLWTFAHPVLDWMFRHHVLVSVIATVIALIVIGFTVRKVQIWRLQRLEVGPTVIIDGRGLDDRVREKLRELEATEVTNRPPGGELPVVSDQ